MCRHSSANANEAALTRDLLFTFSHGRAARFFHRLELIDPAITKNHGRIIKTTGDGMLVEFRSVVDAVMCATEVQRRMAGRNTDVSPARWIRSVVFDSSAA